MPGVLMLFEHYCKTAMPDNVSEQLLLLFSRVIFLLPHLEHPEVRGRGPGSLTCLTPGFYASG